MFTKEKQKQLTRNFFWAKQTDTETPEDQWENIDEIEKEFHFPDFSTEVII